MRFACLQHQQNHTIYNSESVDQNVCSEPVFLHNQQNFVLTPRLQSFSSFWMIFETLLSKNIIGDKDKKLRDKIGVFINIRISPDFYSKCLLSQKSVMSMQKKYRKIDMNRPCLHDLVSSFFSLLTDRLTLFQPKRQYHTGGLFNLNRLFKKTFIYILNNLV